MENVSHQTVTKPNIILRREAIDLGSVSSLMNIKGMTMRIQKRIKRMLIGLMFASLLSLSLHQNSYAGQIRFEKVYKPRVIILTDIENEPDDAMSMVRFMTYTNEFDVEGLVATTSTWQRNKIADWRIREIVEAYGKVRENLLKHAEGYPTKQYLLERIKRGYPDFGMNAVGEGKDSEGSEWIIEVVDRPDPRPVWIPIWGGANCLAQALWKVNQTRSPEEVKAFVDKLRVYTISDQDDSGPWMRKMFPNLFYIVSPGFEENGGGAYHYATWSGISGDRFHGRFQGADFSLVDNPWLEENIIKNHGPLGAEYPRVVYLMEGDTPSFFYLIPNGLGHPEHPDYGCWGGRYELGIPPKKRWHYQQETRPIWTNAMDEVKGVDGNWYTSNHATIWRWREAYQHDFAARIDWSVAEKYEQANHNPVAAFRNDKSKAIVHLSVKSGEVVNLDATGTYDPDGDSIAYQWFVYPEVGSYKLSFFHKIELENPHAREASFIAPTVDSPETIHVILEVKDDGSPSLYSYRRIIVEVRQ